MLLHRLGHGASQVEFTAPKILLQRRQVRSKRLCHPKVPTPKEDIAGTDRGNPQLVMSRSQWQGNRHRVAAPPWRLVRQGYGFPKPSDTDKERHHPLKYVDRCIPIRVRFPYTIEHSTIKRERRRIPRAIGHASTIENLLKGIVRISHGGFPNLQPKTHHGGPQPPDVFYLALS